ncbi:hypothetical protein RclHR1_08630003 [Rhizophagus clarus]|uniref:Transcriptional activator Myb-like isoform X2 n=1 Tax=Rhizophagus clarus TaxID=94130 RepID=A0A2Z6S1S4_9GLOM|nr:hypothetical protein RclHR1_08630003 [Rhizophagus clarus]GES89071.1 transcriptional activator Myb-like isoform X2 [Rhizophagus clarus]
MVGNRKGRWILDEDRLLIRLVSEYSVDGEDIDWSILEQHFKGSRDSKQIRERWVNHLNPRIKKRKFSDEEIKIIEDECSKHKFKWARIAKKIPNATPLMIKNFYNNRLKKKNPANRRLSTSANITPFTINNFNHNPITSTTITKTTVTNNTPNTSNTFNSTNTTTTNINNHNGNYNYYNNEYLQENEISYYNESNLKRSNSDRTIVIEEDNYTTTKVMIAESNYSTTGLSRNGSIRSIMTNGSEKTMVEYEHEYNEYTKPQFMATQMLPSQLPSPPLSAEMMHFTSHIEDENLKFLATVASQREGSTIPSPLEKSEKMAIKNLIS